MENNNMNEQQPNWQQALNEFSDQPQQPVQQAQPEQPQFAQQTQPQYDAQAQYAQQTQPQYNGQPQFTQQDQPQYNEQAQFAQAQGQFTPQGMPAYDAGNFAVVPPKKKNKVLPIVLVILAIAIVAGGVVFACLNLFKNNGGSYETLERNYFASAEKKADELFNTAKDVKTGVEQTMTVNVSKDLLGVDADFAPTVIKATSYADGSANKSTGSATLGCGTDEYLTVKYWLSGEKLYFSIPELSEKYIVMDLKEFASSVKDISNGSDFSDVLTLSDTDTAPTTSGYEDVLKNIDDETINKVMDIIADAYFKNFAGVENKNDTLKTADSTVNCTSYTIDFTTEKVIDFCSDVLDAVEKDSKIMDILSQLGIDNATFQYLKTTVNDATKDASEDELKSVLGTMIVYVKDNNIIGRKITIADEVELILVTYSDNAQFDYSLTVTADSDTFYIGAKGTVNGNNYTGNASLTVSGQTVITADFSFDATNGNGTYSLKVTTDDNQSFEVKVTVAMDGNNGTIDFAVSANGTEAVSVKIDSKETGYVDEAVPDVNDSNTVDINDSAALEAFSSEISNNLPNLITKMQGIQNPDIICYALVSLMAGSMMA